MADVGGKKNPLGQYQARLDAANQQVQQLSPYYELWNMVQEGNPNLQLPESFKQNADFLKQQAQDYQKALKAREKEAKIFDNVSQKYTQYTGDTSLKSALGAQSKDFGTAHNEILGKIADLGDVFGTEKNELVDRINQATELTKKGIAGASQEEMAKTEGLTTRRGFGTKGMENLSKAGITNKETADIATAEAAGIDKISNAVNLYNQLLSNLLAQYKATKDTYVLGNIQNAVNVLSLLNQYKGGKTPTSTGPSIAPNTSAATL